MWNYVYGFNYVNYMLKTDTATIFYCNNLDINILTINIFKHLVFGRIFY